jgi:hypothetical protein
VTQDSRASGAPRPRPSLAVLAAIYVPALIVVVLLVVAKRLAGIDPGLLTRDPAQITNSPIYLGLVSNLGIVLWCAGGVVALFAASQLPRDAAHREARLFLLWSGWLTLALGLDDLVMVHDVVFPDMLHLPEQALFLVYAVVATGYLLRFRESLRADLLLVVLVVVCAGISVLWDQWHLLYRIFGRIIISENFLLEDGGKLFAIAGWMGYLLRTAARALRLRPA